MRLSCAALGALKNTMWPTGGRVGRAACRCITRQAQHFSRARHAGLVIVSFMMFLPPARSAYECAWLAWLVWFEWIMFRLVFFLAFLIGASTASAGVHIGAGWVDEVDGVSSHALTLSYETEQPHPWEFMLGGIDARDGIGLRTPQVWFASASKRFTWRGWFVQGGIAWTDSDTEVLSEHWQFQTGIGYRYRRFTLSLRHLSNANTGGRNRGENVLLLQYGF